MMRKNLPTLIVIILIAMGFFAVGRISATEATLEPPGPPESTSSYTLDSIYQRLVSGAVGAPITFSEPVSGPTTGTMHTLNDIMSVAPALDNTHGATSTRVLTGATVWGLTSGQWGVITGTMPNNGAMVITPATVTQMIAAGFHNGAGHVMGDADLLPGNIRSGITLFGIVGKCTRLPATGQITSFAASDDGAYQLGCLPVVAPSSGSAGGGYNRTSLPWSVSSGPGFTDNGNGTVTDNLTGLVWLKNANCKDTVGSITKTYGYLTWADALTWSNNLAAGSCGLTDGSTAGQWRLPNLNELRSLIDPSHNRPPLPSGHPFTNVSDGGYWSASTFTGDTTYAWYAATLDGSVQNREKTFGSFYVWPVRGGQ